MARVIDPAPAPHQLAFGNLMTYIFRAYQVPLGVGKALTKKEIIDRSIALECYCLPFPTIAVIVAVTVLAPLKAT